MTTTKQPGRRLIVACLLVCAGCSDDNTTISTQTDDNTTISTQTDDNTTISTQTDDNTTISTQTMDAKPHSLQLYFMAPKDHPLYPRAFTSDWYHYKNLAACETALERFKRQIPGTKGACVDRNWNFVPTAANQGPLSKDNPYRDLTDGASDE